MIMSKKEFDKLLSLSVNEETLEIGYIAGSQKVFFVKTGQGGSIYRYLELALKMNEDYGCTVFVSPTNIDKRYVYESEMKLVCEQMQSEQYEIYYMGISKGGLIGCWYADGEPRVKKIAAINAPLMINFHNRTLPAIQSLSSKIKMYYGSLDPSYTYIPFASRFVKVTVIEGADHMLKGHTEMYESIARELLDERF